MTSMLLIITLRQQRECRKFLTELTPLFQPNVRAILRVMNGYELAPEALQVIEIAGYAIGLVIGILVFAGGVGQLISLMLSLRSG